MKTKWHLCILWSVVLLGLLSSAVDTKKSEFSKKKKILKPSAPTSKPVNAPTTEVRSQKVPASPPPQSHLGSLGPRPHVTPRSMRPEKPETKIQSVFAYLPDVSVTCSTSDFVVRVKPAFYGLGADAHELILGSSCRSNGVLRPYGDLLFTYPLTACEGVRELPRGHLVYKYVLHYEPSPKRFPSRAHPVNVDIECRFQRDHYVHQLAVQPTWQTVVMRKRLSGRPHDFQIHLMDDTWDRPANSKEYQLGQTVNFQVSAPHLPAGGKLYISSCYATPPRGSKSSLKYSIINNFGCMLDSKRDPGASQFISRTDKTLRLSLKAFQFTAVPDTEVSIHCALFVTSEAPGPTQKSCTYRGSRWRALTGDDSICKCCESQCVTSEPHRALLTGSASSGPLVVSDQPHTAEDGFLSVGPSLVSFRTEDETVNENIDRLQGAEQLWESVDVVKYENDDVEKEEDEQLEDRPVLGVMTEPDLKQILQEVVLEDVWEEAELKSLTEFEEDGSTYEEWDYSEGEVGDRSEGAEDKISEQLIHVKQKEGEELHHQVHVTADSTKEEVNWTHGGEEDQRMFFPKKDGGEEEEEEMTWYFTWR